MSARKAAARVPCCPDCGGPLENSRGMWFCQPCAVVPKGDNAPEPTIDLLLNLAQRDVDGQEGPARDAIVRLIAAVSRLNGGVEAMRGELRAVQGDARDNAGSWREHDRRLKALEGGKADAS